ncbi:hypothetical protein B0H13DRAFT_132113 [Mycena leptocephala]|nr:hypothetical protein B0H13DRAFT_132113 [Mycena leptocephala]
MNPRSKPQRQRNYAITCGGMVIVLKTIISGSLFIITADGTRKCIEIKVDAASVGTARRPGDENGDVNVTATVRTLSVEGVPVKNEDNEVKLEVLEDDDERLIAYGLSGRPAAGAGVERNPAVADVAEDSTQAPQGNLPKIATSAQSNHHSKPSSPLDSGSSSSTSPSSTERVPTAKNSHTAMASTVEPQPKPEGSSASKAVRPRHDSGDPIPREIGPDPAMPPPAIPSTPSPKKRAASEMDSEPAESSKRSAAGGSRKRVRVGGEKVDEEKVAEERPLRSPRRNRASTSELRV